MLALLNKLIDETTACNNYPNICQTHNFQQTCQQSVHLKKFVCVWNWMWCRWYFYDGWASHAASIISFIYFLLISFYILMMVVIEVVFSWWWGQPCCQHHFFYIFFVNIFFILMMVVIEVVFSWWWGRPRCQHHVENTVLAALNFHSVSNKQPLPNTFNFGWNEKLNAICLIYCHTTG